MGGIIAQPMTPEIAAHALFENFPDCELVATTLGAKGSLLTTREGASGIRGFPSSWSIA